MSVKLEGTFREDVPLHFLFKIESFSMLSENSFVKYESNEFEIGDYTWKLSMYPDGNEDENGSGHISLYLELVDKSLSDFWELNVLFRLFLFDRIRERYYIRGGNPFHEMKKVWGFPQFISLADFKDPANGYLVDDTCVFGAEVFVSKAPGIAECLSLVKQAVTVKHIWKIEEFSNFSCKQTKWKIEERTKCYSDEFEAGDFSWNILMCPNRRYGPYGLSSHNVSLYLCLSDFQTYYRPKVCTGYGPKICTNFTLRLRDQFNVKKIEFSVDRQMFSTSSKIFGCENFIGLDEMTDGQNGYLVNDTCIVEAEVKVLGIVSKRP